MTRAALIAALTIATIAGLCTLAPGAVPIRRNRHRRFDMTHPITIDAARLTWDGRTPTGTELRAWLESLPGSEFATGLLILADALDREPTRPEPADIGADLDELADCTRLFAEAMQKMKAATDSVARKSVARLPRDWTDVDFEDPDHIWLNAFKCIRPTDEFAAEVGRAVIARAMQSHPKRAALTVTAS